MAKDSNNTLPRWIILPVSLVLIVLGLRQIGVGIDEVMSSDTNTVTDDVYKLPIADRSSYTMIDSQGFDPAQPMATVNLPNDWKRQSDTHWQGSEACGYTSQTHLIATSLDNSAKIEITDPVARFIWKDNNQKPGMANDPCIGVTHLQNEIVKTVDVFVKIYLIPKLRPDYQLEEIVEEPDVVLTTPGATESSANTRIKVARVLLSKVTEKRVILETVYVNLRLIPVSIEGDGDYTLAQTVLISLAASEDFFHLINPLLDEVIRSYQLSAEYQTLAGAPGFVPKSITSPSETREK